MAATGQPQQGATCQIDGCGQPAAVAVVWLNDADMDLLCYADLMGMMSASMAEWAQASGAVEQTAAAAQG
jgi:hypothetical protein